MLIYFSSNKVVKYTWIFWGIPECRTSMTTSVLYSNCPFCRFIFKCLILLHPYVSCRAFAGGEKCGTKTLEFSIRAMTKIRKKRKLIKKMEPRTSLVTRECSTGEIFTHVRHCNTSKQTHSFLLIQLSNGLVNLIFSKISWCSTLKPF